MSNQQRGYHLRHPNIMSETERQALPDPCRPIDRDVEPVPILALDDFNDMPLDRYQLSQPADTTSTKIKLSVHSANTLITPEQQQLTKTSQIISDYHAIQDFIDKQQAYSQHSTTKRQVQFFLPLAASSTLISTAGLVWLEHKIYCQPALFNILDQHGMTTPNLHHQQSKTAMALSADNKQMPVEQRLYLLGQLYQIMLSVFLLCQCRPRKTVNPHITLQNLTDAINDYAAAHRTELDFLSQQPLSVITPQHVDFAINALGWQQDKQQGNKRLIAMSSYNPLIKNS